MTNLLDEGFKVKVMHLLTDLQKNIQDLRENLHEKDTRLPKIQSELKNTLSEMKNAMEGINSRFTKVEEVVSDLEIREQEDNEAKKPREKRMCRNERIIRAVI